MKRMKMRIVSKLKNKAGESIAEVLVALLIAALAMTMLATAVASTTEIITRSKTEVAAYYDANNDLDSRVNGTNVTVDDSKIITIKIGSKAVYLNSDTSHTGGEYAVNCYKNDKSGDTPVIAYSLK